MAVHRAEERASEKKRLAQLRNLDISSIEAAGDTQPHPVSESWRFVAVRVTSRRWGFILVPGGRAVSSARRLWRLVASVLVLQSFCLLIVSWVFGCTSGNPS